MLSRLSSWPSWSGGNSEERLLEKCGFSPDNPQKIYTSLSECIKDAGLDVDFWKSHSIHFEKGRALIVDGKGDGPKKIEAIAKHALSSENLSIQEKSNFMAGVKVIFRAHGWKMEEPGLERIRSKTTVSSSSESSSFLGNFSSSKDSLLEDIHVLVDDDLLSTTDSIKIETVPVRVSSKGRMETVDIPKSFYNRSPVLRDSPSPSITLSPNLTVNEFQAYVDFAEDPSPTEISYLSTLQIAEDLEDQETIDKFLTLYEQKLVYVEAFDIQSLITLLPNFSEEMANRLFSFYVNQYVRRRLDDLAYNRDYIPNKLDIICSELAAIPGFQAAAEMRSMHLNLSEADITEEDLWTLERTFPHVHALDISKTNLYEMPLTWQHDLQYLNISDSFISKVPKGFAKLRKIAAKDMFFDADIPNVKELDTGEPPKAPKKKRSFFNF